MCGEQEVVLTFTWSSSELGNLHLEISTPGNPIDMASVQIHTESPISPAVHAPNHASNQPANKTSGLRESSLHSQNQAHPFQDTLRDPASKSDGTETPSIVLPTPTTPSMSIPSDTRNTNSTIPRQNRSSSMSSAPPSPELSMLPAPVSSRSRSVSPRRDIPPPPRVGEKMKPASYYSPTPTPTHPAHQANLPPYVSQTPVSTTFGGPAGLLSPHPATLLSPARTFGSPSQTPVTATMPQKNLEHPPGYVQNPYAADMTPEQRFATQHGASSPSLGYNDGNQGNGGIKSPSGMFQGLGGMVSPRPGVGILNGDKTMEDGSVWGVVSSWAKGAGKKLSEVEGEVWRKINGE